MDQPFHQLKKKGVFFLDGDGTLMMEKMALPGAREFIQHLKRKNSSFYLLTNNSSKTPGNHYEVLKKAGLKIQEENIYVSIQAALAFLQAQGMEKSYWLANTQVSTFIREAGFIFEAENPSALLLTYDNETTYQKLVHFCHLVRQNIPYYATHPDDLYPTREGSIPDMGAFMKVVEMTTGAVPKAIFGKPYPTFVHPILKREGLKEEDAVIIGDRLDTDIQMAEECPDFSPCLNRNNFHERLP